jgi:hypothetical protein
MYCSPIIVRVVNEHEMRVTHGKPGAKEKYINEFVRGSLRKEITPKT